MTSLHMTECRLASLNLARFARERGLSARDVRGDTGYLVHAWFTEALGREVIYCFRVMATAPAVRVLAYTGHDSSSLAALLAENAQPSVAAVVEAPLLTKSLPAQWPQGARYRYECLATPVVRSGNRSKDAFLSSLDHSDPSVKLRTREQVYEQWIASRLAKSAQVESTQIASFELASHVRKTGRVGDPQRGRYYPTLPRVLFRGTLTVTNADSLRDLVEHGVGRETPFGYGMLLLQRLVA